LVSLGDLPQNMSWHFNEVGDADRWIAKPYILSLYVLFLVLIHGTFIILPDLFRANDGIFYFVPNGGAWSAIGKKDEVYNYVFGSFTTYAAVSLVYMMALMHMVVQANLAKVPKMPEPGFWVITWIYLGFVAAWLYFWFEKFSREKLRKASKGRKRKPTIEFQALNQMKKANPGLVVIDGAEGESLENGQISDDDTDDSPEDESGSEEEDSGELDDFFEDDSEKPD